VAAQQHATAPRRLDQREDRTVQFGIPVPTSLFVARADWASPAFTRRIEYATGDLTLLVGARVRSAMTDAGWYGYRQRFAGNATRSRGRRTTSISTPT
jgi:hypothetical protein